MAVSLNDNIYAHALGLVNPAEYYDRPSTDFRGVHMGQAGSGIPSYGGSKHKFRKVGGGWFDDLLSAGKQVVETVAPAVQYLAANPELVSSMASMAGLGTSEAMPRRVARNAIYPPSHSKQ